MRKNRTNHVLYSCWRNFNSFPEQNLVNLFQSSVTILRSVYREDIYKWFIACVHFCLPVLFQENRSSNTRSNTISIVCELLLECVKRPRDFLKILTRTIQEPPPCLTVGVRSFKSFLGCLSHLRNKKLNQKKKM